MALTLIEAAKLSTSSLQAGVIKTFVNSSTILDRIPFMSIEGNAYGYNVEATLPGVAFRGVNEAYVESTGTFNQRYESLVILGGDADVDRFIQITRSNLNDQRAIATEQKVRSASMKFQDVFFNGDVAVEPKGFDGLRKRLTGPQVIDAGPNGAPIVGNGGTDTHTFFDRMDALAAAVPGGPDVFYANAGTIARVLSAGRRIGGASTFVEDTTGKRVVAWNGVPILDAGVTSSGTPVIPQTETVGTSSATSSIYAVKFGQGEGDQAVTGLTNGGVQVMDLGQLQEKPALRTRVEFFTGLAVFGKGAARLRGALAA